LSSSPHRFSDHSSCMSILFCPWPGIPNSCILVRNRHKTCTFWYCFAFPVWARANMRQWNGGIETSHGRGSWDRKIAAYCSDRAGWDANGQSARRSRSGSRSRSRDVEATRNLLEIWRKLTGMT
jgi:hypothetical protein